MKALKPLIVLAVIVGAIIVAVRYTGDSKPTLPEENSAVTSAGVDEGSPRSNKRPKRDAPRLEERYGFTGQTVDP